MADLEGLIQRFIEHSRDDSIMFASSIFEFVKDYCNEPGTNIENVSQLLSEIIEELNY